MHAHPMHAQMDGTPDNDHGESVAGVRAAPWPGCVFRGHVLCVHDGSWKALHCGRIFGTVFIKRFPAVTAQQVRLVIDATVRLFDLFAPGC